MLVLVDNFSYLFINDKIHMLLLISGTLSLIVGSIALNSQWLKKRFLAYSGISHIGFILLGLYCKDTQS
jgi:NADH:ubiquinone oxidoreductase subunit 2 (subunit N)